MPVPNPKNLEQEEGFSILTQAFSLRVHLQYVHTICRTAYTHGSSQSSKSCFSLLLGQLTGCWSFKGQ